MTNDVQARYRQAEAIINGPLTNRLVMNDAVFPHWIDRNRFWYRRATRSGKQYRLVDASDASNEPAFDHEALAQALAQASGKLVDAGDLPLYHLKIHASPLQVRFLAFGSHWLFDASGVRRNEPEAAQQILPSPDGRAEAFVRDWNLWVRDLDTGTERALTTDGADELSYARSSRLVADHKVQARWSPDGKRLFTVIWDGRNVAERPSIHYAPHDGSLRPQLTHLKWAYPGDEHVESYRLLVIDVATGKQQFVDCPPLPLMQYSDYWFGFFTAQLGWWSSDSRHAFFVEVTRGSKAVRVVEFDAHTGTTTRVILEETADTFVKLRHADQELPLVLPLPERNELIWFSERTGWGQLYLYDLASGKLKHPITQGEWLVRDIHRFDPANRELLIQTAGRDPDINPYSRDVCRVNIDTGSITPVLAGDFEHLVLDPQSMQVWSRESLLIDSPDVNGVSPDGDYLVITRSRVDTVPVTVLVDRDGKDILTVETTDVSGLPTGWQWPEPVKLKAADGETDIYGVVYRPPGFSADVHYPVVDYSSTMRQYSAMPKGSFVNGTIFGFDYLEPAAIAALGFIVVTIEGRGLPLRHKAFQDHHYGDPARSSDFDDRIAGLRQLAQRYPYMDLDRVGVTGMETFNNNVYGVLTHPEFYKVAVVHCCGDPRFSHAAIGETFDGTGDAAANASRRHAEDYAESLSGKLLLVTGLVIPFAPSGTFRLVEALQKANKDFDMLCLPRLMHQVTGYTVRRGWDYLVRHLQGIEPPNEYPLTTSFDLEPPAGAGPG